MEVTSSSQAQTAPSQSLASVPTDGRHAASTPPHQLDTVTFEFDAREGPKLANVGLKGSFDPVSGRFDPQWNGGKTLPMYDDGTHGDTTAHDGIFTAQVQLDANVCHPLQWGVQADVPDADGRPSTPPRWLVMTEDPPAFTVGSRVVRYAPVSNREMGVHRIGEDGVRFSTWSPEMGCGDLAPYHLYVEMVDEHGNTERSLPMQKDDGSGIWTTELSSGWGQLRGKGYRYVARNAEGQALHARRADGGTSEVAYSDPCARYLQGPQRGLERMNVDPVLGIETGWYDASDAAGPDYSVNPQWARFTVPGHPKADRVTLRLYDENAHTLTLDALLARIGAPGLVPYEQATAVQKHNVDILRRWQIDTSSPVTRYAWLDHVNPDGTIDLQKVGDATDASWVTAVNNFPALVGLRYSFQAYENGQLVGDTNHDGTLSPDEARRTPFNDPCSNVISAHPGAERLSLVKESSYRFRYDDVPRKQSDFHKFVIYEAHVGSFMGSRDNERASSFADMIRHLDYLDKLGVNTIELLPVQEFAGARDWGYVPDFMFSGAAAYGFEMPREEAVSLGLIDPDERTGQQSVWVDGTDALKLFVDEAHRRGFNVMSDVVYNHVAGRPDAEDPLALIDGEKQSFFKWNGQAVSMTPWGPKPNFGSQGVKDFYANNAAQQIDELHVDGMRFDFVQTMHDTGSVDERRDGMNMLRQITRTVRYLKPDAYLVAEDFTHNWLVAADLDKSEWQGDGPTRMEKKGMGFGGVWNDSFHHALRDAVAGRANMDELMEALTLHVGVSGWDRAVVFSHNHDEVGNSGTWMARVAANSVKEADIFQPYPRAIARSTAALTLTSAGVPLLWQGEEQLANNDFKHAMPSTWGSDLEWMSFAVTPERLDDFKRIALLPPDQKKDAVARLPEEERKLFSRYDAMSEDARQRAEIDADRAGQFKLYQDLIALRMSSPGLSAAPTGIGRLYTHNDDRVMAVLRHAPGSSEDFIVVTNFAKVAREGYNIGLPPGGWQVVLNTADRVYGGDGSGTHGALEGNAWLALPAGGTLVLKRQA